MNKIGISTAAFCLWDIGPERKLEICRDFGFDHVVIALSTIKMMRQFVSLSQMPKALDGFSKISIQAPWRGIRYGENKQTQEVCSLIQQIQKRIFIQEVIFSFDCMQDFHWLSQLDFSYYIKNPLQSSWDVFSEIVEKNGLQSVLDINRASRKGDYLEQYLKRHHKQIKSIHVSGFVEELGRTPIVESGQKDLLDKIKNTEVPVVIEGLFSPGDFDGIREEIRTIAQRVYGEII